ncbi:carboxylic ester hydrolase [Tieghemostelium lacteum]|uniref:Carboxylic ester hydrolase n=1 Tax=Tieghemostelium lacteum TaxID=361077 RepID=A0A152A2Q1_TIELA|nr:carboxylic ester hydrolase [Tieghemostelium lacteum]|eukprot:KYR00533.1 carboxylic ester hydrolase [Tieghemostelium lacteum]
MVMSFGYPCEEHFVTTEDGYILGVFRIPHGRNQTETNKKPVLLQHGLLDSSITFIINLPSESLSYILADAGYDVWLGNNRGNEYSTNHTTLSNSSKEFWEFSYDEMGLYDLPATVDYILDQTSQSTITYVGHSEGTMQAFIAYLKVPLFSEKVPLFFALGPVGNVTNITNKGLRTLADFHIDTILRYFGMNRFLPSPTVLKGLFVDFCIECDICCADVVEWICGPHKGAFNDSRMPIVSGHEPSGTSTQNIQHFAQGVTLKQFQMFDYGPVINIQKYQSIYPPIYDLTQFPSTVKIALYSGTLDELADPIDVKQLVSLLPTSSILNWMIIDDYAHLDYVWALDAHQIIYTDILSIMSNSTL